MRAVGLGKCSIIGPNFQGRKKNKKVLIVRQDEDEDEQPRNGAGKTQTKKR
jgi:hypothetical protein